MMDFKHDLLDFKFIKHRKFAFNDAYRIFLLGEKLVVSMMHADTCIIPTDMKQIYLQHNIKQNQILH